MLITWVCWCRKRFNTFSSFSLSLSFCSSCCLWAWWQNTTISFLPLWWVSYMVFLWLCHCFDRDCVQLVCI